MNVYFIRHGERVPQRKDIGLTERGIKQATVTGNYLKKFSIDVVIASPYVRAKQTAQIIANRLKLSYTTDDRLKERVEFEEIKEQSYEKYLQLCYFSTKHRNYTLPNGETSFHTGKSLEQLIFSLKKNRLNNIVLVSHEGSISDYLRNIFSVQELRQMSNSYVKYFELDECSITQLLVDKTIRLISLNSITHLPRS